MNAYNSLRCMVLASVLLGGAPAVGAEEIFARHSSWRYALGYFEASYPATDTWRAINFDESYSFLPWASGTTPIGFGETNITTKISASGGGGWRWVSVFFRKTFTLANPNNLSELIVSVWIDDGCAVWINGRPVGRYNVAEGDLTFDTPTYNPLPLGAIEPTLATFRITNDLNSILVPGTNVIAVQGFNVSRNSDDFFFDASLEYVPDQKPPTIANLIPPAGVTVPVLTQVEVTFDESVAGLDAADLLVNGTAARKLVSLSDSQYIIEFDSPVNGSVQLAWSASHGISDLANPANPFAGGEWTYTLDPRVPSPDLILSEFMADNDKGIHDEDGADSDWIEIYNPGYASVDLTGWHLTTSARDLAAWTFPPISLLANRYLLVYASGKDRTNPAAPLHTNFKLDKDGGYLALVKPNSQVISEFAPAYPPQRTDVSYGRDRLDTNLLTFFTLPTPGGPNTVGGPGFAPEVEFSSPSRTFTDAFALVLSTVSSNAVIHYTLGTNLPTEASPVYDKPLIISASSLVRARAFATGLLPGPIRSETYLQLGPDVQSFSSDLPIVVLHNLGGGPVPGSVDQFVALQVFEPRTSPSSLTNTPSLATPGIIHKRGRSTQGYAKASFFLETRDELGDDRNVSLAGLPEESDWVLYAPNSFDPVLIHNPMAHELMRQMGRYSPRTRFVEVYLKDNTGAPGPITAADYNGVYVLEEKIKIGKNRVDIDKLQPEHTAMPQVSGGYLLSIDNADSGTIPFYGAGTSINYLDPDYFEITTPQRDAQERYLSEFFNAFDQALNGPQWTDPRQGYAAFIDVAAAIDHHIQGVVTFNVDALRLSGYFHIPRNGKLTLGPVWDFDRTQGSADGRDFNPRLWRSTVPDYGTDMFNSDPQIFTNPWYSRMFQDLDFWQKWIDRYQELRQGTLQTTNVAATIDALANAVRQAQVREVNRWRGSQGSDTTPRSGLRSSAGYSYRFSGTYQGEVDFMKLWYSNRLDFIDGQLLMPPTITPNNEPLAAGSTLTLTGPSGATIYYTLDGSDPRLPGGAVSSRALVYDSPIALESNICLVARCQDPNHKNLTGPGKPPLSSTWSGPVQTIVALRLPPLVITEIMYHPPAAPDDSIDAGDFEYLELKNLGESPLSLLGFQLTEGVAFSFPDLTLAAGEVVLVVRNQAAFASRYGTNHLIAGVFTGQLDNAGERLVLKGPLQETLLDFTYDNRWYPITDGRGFSLVIVQENAPLDAWNLSTNWRPSSTLQGSPGQTDPPPPVFPRVVIHEALTHAEPPQLDFIELHNATTAPAEVSGWWLSDDFTQPQKFRIPDGTTLAPGGFLVLTESDYGANADLGFGLSSLGDEVYLFSANSSSNLTGYVHGFDFGAAEAGVSFGRYITSTGEEYFVAQDQLTPGATNSPPRTGPVVINELMYHPASVYLTNNNARDEFIELHNPTAQPVALFDPLFPTNTWQLEGGIAFVFPTNLILPPLGYLVVVGFDPVHHLADLAAFRQQYQLDSQVLILGPWSGQLENRGESITLSKPSPPQPAASDDPGRVPLVRVDQIDYSPLAPWPTHASNSGNSIQRMTPTDFGNDPVNWLAASPTPGARNSRGTLDSDNDGLPDDWELAYGLNPNDPANGQGANDDPDQDRLTNLQEYTCGTHPLDPSSYLQLQATREDPLTIRLRFPTVAGKTYSLLYRPDVGSGAWVKLKDIPASSAAGELEVQDLLSDSTLQRFYQLVTPAWP